MPLPSIKRKSSIILVGTILIVLAFILLYYLIMVPLKKDVQSLKVELQTEERMVKQAQTKATQKTNVSEEDTIALQQKLPVKPLVDQFLLDLEKAEVISNSTILSMKFGDATSEEQANDPLGQFNQQQKPANTQSEKNEKTQSLPNGIEKVTVHLSIESPSYLALENFIKTLEDLKRITKVDQISFKGYQEITPTQENSIKLDYDVTVSTYYLPGLKELIDQVPQIDVPDPSKKTNPLAPNDQVFKIPIEK